MAEASRHWLEGKRFQFWLRVFVAGPWAFCLSFLVMVASPSWVPSGAGGVNHVLLPLFFQPLIWAILFFYAILERNILRAALIFALVTALNAWLIRAYLFG